MSRRKLTVVLICITITSIFTVYIIQNTSISELLLQGYFVGRLLTHKTPPMPKPTEIFTEHILDPIPKSVTNLKADRPYCVLGYTYTLHFNINRADLALIIGSRPFQRVWDVKYGMYGKGNLHWCWDPPGSVYTRFISMIVYHPEGGRREPKWFKPNQWDNPEVYAFQKVGDCVNAQAIKYIKKGNEQEITQVLLYNEKDQEAYFIISNLR
jgi:hypothetical protein